MQPTSEKVHPLAISLNRNDSPLEEAVEASRLEVLPGVLVVVLEVVSY